jgi:hypothetical protein
MYSHLLIHLTSSCNIFNFRESKVKVLKLTALVPYGAVNRNKVSIRQLPLYFPSHSLHVSAPMGHLQVRYIIRYS